MRVMLRDHPNTIATILDGQHRGIGFTLVRLELFQKVQEAMPGLALLCAIEGRIVHVEVGSLELYNLKMLSILNASASA